MAGNVEVTSGETYGGTVPPPHDEQTVVVAIAAESPDPDGGGPGVVLVLVPAEAMKGVGEKLPPPEPEPIPLDGGAVVLVPEHNNVYPAAWQEEAADPYSAGKPATSSALVKVNLVPFVIFLDLLVFKIRGRRSFSQRSADSWNPTFQASQQ
jgi:hypothetical protein